MNKETKQKDIESNDILICAKPLELTDGLHEGKITYFVSSNRSEYDYMEVGIITDDNNNEEIELHASFPRYLSMGSSLGKFLKKAGFNIRSGEPTNLSDVADTIRNKKVTFQTTTEETDKGTFHNIIVSTIQFI